jgi:3-isopropylmalate dehydratase small subunit
LKTIRVNDGPSCQRWEEREKKRKTKEIRELAIAAAQAGFGRCGRARRHAGWPLVGHVQVSCILFSFSCSYFSLNSIKQSLDKFVKESRIVLLNLVNIVQVRYVVSKIYFIPFGL